MSTDGKRMKLVDIADKRQEWTDEARRELHEHVDVWLEKGDCFLVVGVNETETLSRWIQKNDSKKSRLEVLALLDQVLLREKMRSLGLIEED